MLMRMACTVATGQGEQVVIDIPSWNPVTGREIDNFDEMVQLLDKAFVAVDKRVLEMNTRMLEAYDLVRRLPIQHQQQFVALLDILAGRQSAATVRARWDSIAEENAALAADRLAVLGVDGDSSSE